MLKINLQKPVNLKSFQTNIALHILFARAELDVWFHSLRNKTTAPASFEGH